MSEGGREGRLPGEDRRENQGCRGRVGCGRVFAGDGQSGRRKATWRPGLGGLGCRRGLRCRACDMKAFGNGIRISCNGFPLTLHPSTTVPRRIHVPTNPKGMTATDASNRRIQVRYVAVILATTARVWLSHENCPAIKFGSWGCLVGTSAAAKPHGTASGWAHHCRPQKCTKKGAKAALGRAA